MKAHRVSRALDTLVFLLVRNGWLTLARVAQAGGFKNIRILEILMKMMEQKP
jgi:hypothetical protein